MTADRSNQETAYTDLAQALGEYLASIGWTAVVVSTPRIEQREPVGPTGIGRYEFVLTFTGGKRPESPA